ncbi:armadillo-type protein [Blyttiomyces helicus]|uniref:Armadillo-type protein n=1 Tax=Blyttiomyces helicus TaxID=388810 RepID=A0A4P9WI75_9FUNG|nr:armadillo-type protein [Blyttiomyces helicus]|eukprot:RKO91573.1 armadillo-type protein [Blyttiomyces helicus]
MSALDQICATLAMARESVDAVRKPAEAQLKRWEVEPGFHSTLQEVAYTRTIDVKIRHLAILLLKNGVERFWRKKIEVGGIQPEEKARIRAKSLTFFDEEVKDLAKQNAVIVSRIAAIDFPNHWPDLLQTLVQTVQASDATSQALHFRENSLYVLALVVKTLGAKQMPASKRLFQQLAPEIFTFTSNLFVDRTNNVFSKAESLFANGVVDHADLATSLRIALLCLKALRMTIVYGIPNFSKQEAPVQFLGLLLQQLPKFLQLRKGDGERKSSLFHTYSGFSLASPIVADPKYERVLLQALTILKNIIKHPSLALLRRQSDSPELIATQTAAKQVQKDILRPEFVTACTQILVSRYLIMSPEDLQTWEEDPESFIEEEESDRWEYSLRPCASKVVIELIATNRDLLGPVVVNMLTTVSVDGTVDMNAILIKDAVYCVVGSCAQDMYDYVDFDNWFHQKLIPDATHPDPRTRILRRRVAWLIGEWIDVKTGKEVRGDVYRLLHRLMSEEEDLVVRLAAVATLRKCVDDLDFEIPPFLPYLEPTVRIFAALVEQVEESDSKRTILMALAVVVERVESHLIVLLQAVGPHSMSLHEFIIPIIAHSVDLDNREHVHLLEDGLDLWLSVMHAATECTPALLQLFTFIPKLFETETDTLRIALKLVEAYVLLAPQIIMESLTVPVVERISNLLGDSLKLDASNALLRCVDTLLLAASAAGPACFSKFCEQLVASRMLEKLVRALVENLDEVQVRVGYATILARVALCDAAFFRSLCLAFGGGTMGAMVDAWCDKVRFCCLMVGQ